MILDKPWDVLIILDACRYDIFKTHNRIPGKLEKRVSNASMTRDWLIRNFKNQPCKDIDYYSANPYVSRAVFTDGLPFHHVHDIWDNSWDHVRQTVHPLDVNRWVLEYDEIDFNYRNIIHYMQPHHPFIGTPGLVYTGLGDIDEFESETPTDTWPMNISGNVWEDIMSGAVGRGVAFRAYEDNLKLALIYVEPLVKRLREQTDKTIVISSDHGNLFGEYNMFGHPSIDPKKANEYPELFEVPWLVVD